MGTVNDGQMDQGTQGGSEIISIPATRPPASNSRPMAQEVRGDHLGHEDSQSGSEAEQGAVSTTAPRQLAFSNEISKVKDDNQGQQDAQPCGQPLAQNNGNEGKKLEAKAISVDELITLLAQQGQKCALTGRTLTPSDVALDHIRPLASDDGSHELDNLQLVVNEANTAKGTLSQGEFIELCRDVVRTWGM